MKRIAYTLIAFAFGVFSAKAQTDTTKNHGWMHRNLVGAAQIQVTYRQYDMGALNSALNAGGIPSVSDNNIWFNLSMSHENKNWITEDGLGFTPFSTSTVNNIRTRFNQYQAYFRLGYNVSKVSDFRLYPFIGANFSDAVLNVQDNNREQNTSNFSQALLNSTSSKTLYQPNFGIELGAGFDYLIKLKPKKMDCFEVERNIPIGIRAGYYFNTYASDWKISDYNLNNGPNNKQSAVFVSLNIGLGYKINK